MASSVLGLASLVLMTFGFFLAVPLVLIPAVAGALWYTRRRPAQDAAPAQPVVVRRGSVATDGDTVPVEAVRAA